MARAAEPAMPKPAERTVRTAEALQEPVTNEPGSAEEPTGDITLMQALAAALVGNPEFAAFSQEICGREAAVLQAGLRPNPTLNTLAQNFGKRSMRGIDGGSVTLDLGQLIELGGKRAARIE